MTASRNPMLAMMIRKEWLVSVPCRTLGAAGASMPSVGGPSVSSLRESTPSASTFRLQPTRG